MNKIIFALSFLTAFSAYADDTTYKCTGKGIEVEVTFNYRTQAETIVIHRDSGFFRDELEVKVPMQIETSTDPTWTSSPFKIKPAGIDRKGTLFVGKGGTYLKLYEPVKTLKEGIKDGTGTQTSPAVLNTPYIKNGRAIKLSCTQLIFG